MSEAQKIKNVINQNMHRLCAHCASGNHNHRCPLQQISQQLDRLRGVPLMVNGEFRGMLIEG